MRPMIPVLALLLAGCAQPVPSQREAFARQLAGHVAGAPQSCVSSFGNESLRAVDPRTVAYGSGRTIYVNNLGADCPGMSSFNTVIVEAHGNQFCRGDRVRGLEPGGIIPGPNCLLGDWVPYRTP